MSTKRRRVFFSVAVGLVLLAGGSAALIGYARFLKCPAGRIPLTWSDARLKALSREELLHEYGQPSFRGIGVPTGLRESRALRYLAFELLQRVQPQSRSVELLVWETKCRGEAIEELAVVIDPETGALLAAGNGEPLLGVRHYQ